MRALLVFALSTTGLVCSGYAQRVVTKPHAVAAAAANRAATTKRGELRVTHVSLYKNGVGFFEHEGQVTGDESVSLELTSAQLNDVLQTLTAVDLGGGHITGANFNSTTPLDQQLGTLPLSLGEQPSEEDLYSALRGARVEVTGSGPAFTGRILSLEIRTPAAPENSNEKPEMERRFLTVISDAGATRTLEMTPLTTVRLMDTGLRTDLNTYLELLDRNRTESIRHLTLTDHGAGTRVLHVSFLSEVPVWKSTYRLLVTDSPGSSATQAGSTQAATLQGFSVVDNTTGEDWNNVQLSLIAGNPQSFLQPLAQPIYDRRAQIPIAENAQTTPQTHESAITGNDLPPGSASASLGSGAGGNPTALFGSPSGTGSGEPMRGPLLAARKIPRNINIMKDTGAPPPPAPYASASAASASVPPGMYEDAARESTAVNTTTAAIDDFFAYNLTDPVTIPRNGSALVPILQTQLPTERVTLWSPTEPRPLRALWLTNDSQLTLDRGSFSVVENGAFAGEGLLDQVHPGEKRLLSYAVDEAVRVTPMHRHDTRRVTSISVSKGVVRAANSEVAEVSYTVSNAAPEPRTVIIEEPRRTGWTLDADAKPAETTPNAYRFRVVATSHQSASLHVTQRHTLDEFFRLADTTEEQLTYYVRNGGADPAVLTQLQPVFAAKQALADMGVRIEETRSKIEAIVQDQKRVRDDLAALKGSAEERSLARRYTAELNAQEDSLADLRRQLATLEQQSSAAAAELSQRIASVQIPAVP